MDVLVFSPTPTFPADQGNRSRVNSLCQAFRDRGAKIHFVYFPREWGGRFSHQEHEGMSTQWDYFHTVAQSKPFMYQTEGQYFQIDDWWDDAIGDFIRYKVAGHRFQACIVNYAFFSKVFEFIPDHTLKILDTHDRLSNRREMLEQNGINPEFFYTSEAEEKIALDRSDIVIAITAEEAAYFRTKTDKLVVTLGHLAKPAGSLHSKRRRNKPFRMGFLGSSNSVNVKNIQNFLNAVHSLRPEGLADIELHLYGSCCARVTVPDTKTRVVSYGRVEDVSDFYSNIDCVFVPFLFGTGQKIKVIEALSHGVPMICTRSASEGSGAKAPAHVLEDFEGVISAMEAFASNGAYRTQLERETKEAFKHYTRSVEASVDALAVVIGQRGLDVSLDARRLVNRLAGVDRKALIDAGTFLISSTDMLASASDMRSKSDLIEQFDRAVTRALGLSAPPPKSMYPRPGQAVVAFADTADPAVMAKGKARITLYGPAFEHARPPAPDGLTMHISLAGVTRAAPTEFVGLAPSFYHNHQRDRRYENILILCDDLDAPDLHAFADEIERRLFPKLGRRLPVHFTDRSGRRGRLANGTVLADPDDPSFMAILRNARALAMGGCITVGFRLGCLSGGAFFDRLIHDGGPFISVASGAVAVADEVAVRSAQEAAIWISVFATCPLLANMYTSRRRNGLASIGSAEEQIRIARSFLSRVENETHTTALDALMENERALAGGVRK